MMIFEANGHTRICNEIQERQTVKEVEFRHQWPMFCRACRGAGIWSESFDPSPSGVSLSSGSMTDSGSCPVCVEEGVCPRCANETLVADGASCMNCFWAEGDPGLPEQFECDCSEQWNRLHLDEVRSYLEGM